MSDRDDADTNAFDDDFDDDATIARDELAALRAARHHDDRPDTDASAPHSGHDDEFDDDKTVSRDALDQIRASHTTQSDDDDEDATVDRAALEEARIARDAMPRAKAASSVSVPRDLDQAIAEISSTSTGEIGTVPGSSKTERQAPEWSTDETAREEAIEEARRLRQADTVPYETLLAELEAARALDGETAPRPEASNETDSEHESAEASASPLLTLKQDTGQKKRRWGTRKILLLIAAVVALLAVVGVAAVGLIIRSVNEQLQTMPRSEIFHPIETPPPAADHGYNVLVLGVDSTDPVATVAKDGGERSDVMMVVNFAGDGKSITVMSVMRDTWLDVPGYGEAKINAALSTGGLPRAVETVQSKLGIKIDHAALVNFSGFSTLTDLAGGVTVHNDEAFVPLHGNGKAFPAGDVTLDGKDALAFVRERYSFTDGDYTRVKNQQEFLRALLSGLSQTQVLGDPGKLANDLKAVSRDVLVDSGMDAPTISRMALHLRDAAHGNLRFFTAPTSGTAERDGQSVVLLDDAKMKAVQTAFQKDAVAAYAEAHKNDAKQAPKGN